MSWKALFITTLAVIVSAPLQASDQIVSTWQDIHFIGNKALNQHLFIHDMARDEVVFKKAITDNATLPAKVKQHFINAVHAYQNQGANLGKHIIFDTTQISYLTAQYLEGVSPKLSECPDICPQLVETLQAYEIYFWPTHQAQNRAWHSQASDMLNMYGTNILTALEHAFQSPLIKDTHRVNIVYKQGLRHGAATSSRGLGTIIASSHDQIMGLYALETLFHEIVHAIATNRRSPLRTLLKAELDKQSITNTRELWHAIHFYTVGYIVRQELAKASIDHIPYAEHYGLYQRAWGVYRPLIEQHWLAYLQGKNDMQTAIQAIVADLEKQG